MFNKKYIMTPDPKPMYAMVRCCGPQMGPLTKPTPTPLAVIADILTQKDGPTLFEVLPENPQLTRWSRPVQLTKDNYMLPYDEILAPMLAGESAKKDVEEDEYVQEVSMDESDNLQTDPVSKTEEVATNLPRYKVSVDTPTEPDEYDLTDEELEARTNPDI